MGDTIERVMRPYFVIAFFMGSGIYGHSQVCLSIIYILIVWSVYVWALLTTAAKFVADTQLIQFLSGFMVGINLFLSMLSIFIAFYGHEKYRVCIKKLNLVDDTLKELGIPKEYDKERTMIKQSLIFWLIQVCLMNTLDGLLCVTQHNNISAASIPWVVDHFIHINTLQDLTIVFILRYIGNKLDKINDCIVQLSENVDCGLRCIWKKSLTNSRLYIRSTEYRKRVLWTAMHLHLELYWIARNINVFYGMQMTVQMASYFVLFIGLSYFQYHALTCLVHIYESGKAKLILVLSTDVWSIFFLFKLITINSICESVSAKAEKTRIVIHKLTNLTRFADMHDVIFQFDLYLLLHPLKFSGMGLFYFGYKFTRSFFVWIFTILLFIVQEETSSLKQISSRTNVSSCFF